MGIFGNILSFPVKIVNAPIRAAENLLDCDEDDRIVSKPLDSLAKELKKIDE